MEHCRKCRKLKARTNKVPPCMKADGKCRSGKPKLLPANKTAINIFMMYQAGFQRQDGIDLLAIDKVMDYEDVPVFLRPTMVRKILLYAAITTNKIFKESSKGVRK